MPESLVRNERAERAYAAAWASWLLATDREEKTVLERVMDAEQEKIATSPADPRWQKFADSLPGYREFWSRDPLDIAMRIGGKKKP
jgi:hypothetical protein